MKQLIIISLVILFSACGKTETTEKITAKNNQIAVISEKGSALRIDPYVYSAKVGELSRGDKVQVLESSKVKAYIGRSSDFWYKIKTDDGLTGWIYGSNIKIFSAGSDFSANNFEKQMRDEDLDEVSKKIIGKWWSVNTKEEFTSYWISLFKDGTYESKNKDSSKLYKGNYTIDVNDSVIKFDASTPLGNEIKFSQRGLNYFLEYADQKNNYRFKQISSDPKSSEEVETVPEKKEPAAAIPAEQNQQVANDQNQ